MDTLTQVVEELKKYEKDGVKLYAGLIAGNFRFIDPAVNTARECYEYLQKTKELTGRNTPGRLNAYISVPSAGLSPDKLDADGNLKYEYKYGRETGQEEITTPIVPFSRTTLNADNLKRIENLLPASYLLIEKFMKE
jgi:hypothetical protein